MLYTHTHSSSSSSSSSSTLALLTSWDRFLRYNHLHIFTTQWCLVIRTCQHGQSIHATAGVNSLQRNAHIECLTFVFCWSPSMQIWLPVCCWLIWYHTVDGWFSVAHVQISVAHACHYKHTDGPVKVHWSNSLQLWQCGSEFYTVSVGLHRISLFVHPIWQTLTNLRNTIMLSFIRP